MQQLCKACGISPAFARGWCKRCYTLASRHGFEPEDIMKVLLEQGGTCAICKNPPSPARSLSIDHDHQTGAFRGWLCTRCNLGLGYFSTLELTKAAQDYLEKAAPYTRTWEDTLDQDSLYHLNAVAEIAADQTWPILREKARVLASMLDIGEEAALSRLRRHISRPRHSRKSFKNNK